MKLNQELWKMMKGFMISVSSNAYYTSFFSFFFFLIVDRYSCYSYYFYYYFRSKQKNLYNINGTHLPIVIDAIAIH